MATMTSGILVIPFFNESHRFQRNYFETLISRVKQHNWKIVFVNDGSTDDTLELFETLENSSSCLILNWPYNEGKGNAIRRGMNLGLASFPEIKHIAFVDADGAFDIEDIDNLVLRSKSEQFDLIIGARIKLAGKNIDRSLDRHIVGRLISTLINLLVFKKPIYDPQSGLKVFRVSTFLKSALSQSFETKWFGDVELISRLWVQTDLEIREYPVSKWREVSGGNLNFLSVLLVIKELTYVIYHYGLKSDKS
jgi:glycosyltransferase involved in cell wall biosynthesis